VSAAGVNADANGGAIGSLHTRMVYQRRLRVLREALVPLLPPHAHVLDVGCGDGLLASMIVEARPDVSLQGIDVLVRPLTHIAVQPFDGSSLPFADNSFDAVMFVDVLHHTDDPCVLLREAARVASNCVIIKDHTRNGVLAGATLRLMDWVGNAHHGVRLPYNYWTGDQWQRGLTGAGLQIETWVHWLPLYPWWASWAFGRSLHFVARAGRHRPA